MENPSASNILTSQMTMPISNTLKFNLINEKAELQLKILRKNLFLYKYNIERPRLLTIFLKMQMLWVLENNTILFQLLAHKVVVKVPCWIIYSVRISIFWPRQNRDRKQQKVEIIFFLKFLTNNHRYMAFNW